MFYDNTKGIWVGQVNLGTDTHGRRLRPKVHAPSAAAARAKLDDLKAAHNAGQDITQRDYSVAELTQLWLDRGLHSSLTENTRANYAALLDTHVLPAAGRHRVTALTPEHVEALLDRMAEHGYAARTMRLVLSLLRRVLQFGQRRGVTLRNVADLVQAPAGPTATRSGLTTEQARALLAAARTERLGGLITLSLLLGLRPGEAAGLTWDAINLDTDPAVLNVEHSLRRTPNGMVLAPPKTMASRRSLALPEPAIRALHDQAKRQAADAAAAGQEWANPDRLVFTTETGTPLDPSNVRRALNRIASTTGIAHLHPHQLRHATASLLSDAGVPLEQIADLLGHHSPTTTADIYRHPINQVRRPHLPLMTQIATDAGTTAADGT